MKGRAIALVLGLGLVAAGCGGAGAGAAQNEGSATGGPSGDPKDDPTVCEPPYPPPTGFLPSGVDRVPGSGAIGVRRSFVDDAERTLHLTSGIEGEFGEGLPVADELEVATGETGVLLGSGPDWFLVWSLERPCATQTVAGTGFSKAAFTDALRRMGVLPGPAEANG